MKVTCIKGVTFLATGESYVEGGEYDVPAKTANDYPGNFKKKAGKPKTKKTETEENK